MKDKSDNSMSSFTCICQDFAELKNKKHRENIVWGCEDLDDCQTSLQCSCETTQNDACKNSPADYLAVSGFDCVKPWVCAKRQVFSLKAAGLI